MIEQQNNPIENVDVNAAETNETGASVPVSASAITSPIDFLKAIYPEGPWCLSAINPAKKGHIVTMTFGAETASQAKAWIDSFIGKWNLYFAVNPVRTPVTKKPDRTDIASVNFLHVDIDPRVGEDLDEERRRILALLTTNLPEGIPKPTIIISSGGGYQGFWMLVEPLTLDGSVDQADGAKLWNLALEHRFGADSCHNIDRIMRLPETINVPDAKKRSKGRTPAPTAVVDIDLSRVYSLSDFPKAVLPGAAGSAVPGAATAVDLSGDQVTLIDVHDLDAYTRDKKPIDDRIKRIIQLGNDPLDDRAECKDKTDRSLWVFDVACDLVRRGVPDNVIVAVLIDRDFRISDHLYDRKGDVVKYAVRQIERAKQIADAKAAVDDDKSLKFGDDDKPTWRELAQAFIDAQVTPLLRYAGEWLAYRRGAYGVRDDETIRSAVYDLYSQSSSAFVSNVLDAAKGLVLKDQHDFDPPCWLDNRDGPDASEQLVVRNGIVDMTTGELRDHDPQLFTYNALDYDYDPDAPKPERWLKFVNEVFPEDSIDLVQQIGGYLLTPDTSRQAIFVFVGVSRSGKGTFGRVLSGILGRHNVCSPSLSNLGTQFGQQVLIGKTVALISEMKLDKRDAKEAVARVLLNISGEDPVAIPRKNKTDWEGRLGTRVVILANTPPTLSDASGALMRRYVVVEMPTSFAGREDPNLEDALLAERSGILKWFIEGRRKLPRRFVTPASSADVIEQVDRLGSPVKAFVADRCVFSPEAQCTKDQLYGAYCSWHNDSGLPAASKFGKELFSARLLEAYRDKVKSKQPGQKKGDARRPSRVWAGIRLLTQVELKEQWDDELAAHSYEAVDPESNPEDLPF